ncbi:MAG: HAD family phosphatase [Alphaproteobacteria bacterium]
MSKMDFSPLIPYLDKIDGVAWDCDGTLVDNETRALKVIQQEFERHLAKATQFKVTQIECCLPYVGTALPNIRQIISQKYNTKIPQSVEDSILRRRSNSPEPDEKVIVVPAMAALVKFFGNNGVPQMVVTSSERARATRYIEAAKLDRHFDTSQQWLISGHDDFEQPRHKPHPDAHNRAKEMFAANGRRMLAFEDSIAGVEAAREAGIPVIGQVLASHVTEDRKDTLAMEMLRFGAVAVIYRPEDLVPALVEIVQAMPERPSRLGHSKPERPSANHARRLRVVGGADYEPGSSG